VVVGNWETRPWSSALQRIPPCLRSGKRHRPPAWWHLSSRSRSIGDPEYHTTRAAKDISSHGRPDVDVTDNECVRRATISRHLAAVRWGRYLCRGRTGTWMITDQKCQVQRIKLSTASTLLQPSIVDPSLFVS
jgi:hypothetical protein